MICVLCNKGRQKSKQDPAFCQKCYDSTTLMNRTVAAVAYLDDASEEEKLYGFLSLFHPELSHKEKLELAKRD